MKLNKYIFPLSILLWAVSTGCSPKKPAAAEQREKWLASLNDSISTYQKQIEEVNNDIEEARKNVGNMIGHFEYVEKPRQVEGYYILNGWKNKYPLMNTGLVARVNKSEGFELIATLTGAHFNEIGVTSGTTTLQSAVVPHDQALNYRAGNLNTVCFSGERADSIGAFIAANESATVTVAYLNGKRSGTHPLSEGEKTMIAQTWRLYHSQKELHKLEKEIPRLSGKISACRRMLESADSTNNPTQNI